MPVDFEADTAPAPRVVKDAETRSPDEIARLKKTHATALAKFHASASFFQKQREREVDDLKFVDFDEQWPEDVKASRQGAGASGGLPATAPRPTLTINTLRGPCQ